jgi:KTSC domain-containing protein
MVTVNPDDGYLVLGINHHGIQSSIMAQEIISHPPSTNIMEVVYDKDTQTLTILFAKGGVIEFYEVDETSAHGFETALSATKYMNAFIENQFPSQRIS